MGKNIKYGKIVIVILLTILIWIWADRALDDVLSVSSVTINITRSANRNILASFNDERSIALDRVVLKGPSSTINDVKRALDDGSLDFDLFLDPEQQAVGTAEYHLDVLSFLRNSTKIKKLGLTAESCQPQKLILNVVELVNKPLTIKCVDEGQGLIKAAIVKPAQVDMFVPKQWEGETLTAKVQLSTGEINQARLSPIERTPHIKLAGQTRKASQAVKISMPKAADLLSDFNVTRVALSLSLSANLQGKYKIEVTNLDAVMGTIAIRATVDAKKAYEDMRYQVILEVDDEDVKQQELRRVLVYNFPDEYISKGEIVLNQQPVVARFKLISLLPE